MREVNREIVLLAYALVLLLSSVENCFQFVKPVGAATNTIEGDYDVDSADLFMLASAYVLERDDPLYEANCNSEDGAVDSMALFTHKYDMPVEMVISRRMSIRSFYLNIAVPWELVSTVLWAAIGYSWWGRTVPSLSGYPIIIYVCNSTAAYKFIPENQMLTLWKEGDYRGLGGGVDAPTQLYIVLDTSICPDVLWGNAESGCTIQNIYLMANALSLGTVCQYRRTDIHEGLGLPANEKILYKMPLGYPLSPYANYENLVPTDRPFSLELPEIQDSNVSFEDALNSVFLSHGWSEDPVTRQELSQVLWASYGYSYYEDIAASPPKRHRTVPSAHAYYPMKVYAANSSGVYEYLPEQHTLATIVTEDRRPSIAQASGHAWASSAPLIISVAYVENSKPYTIGGEETYVEVGLITQNVCLECAAWGLIADWGKADMDEEAMRDALGLGEDTHLHPVSVITVGHQRYRSTDLNSDGTVNIQDLFIIAKAYGSHGPDIPNPGDPGSEKWNPVADVNNDGWVSIKDLFEVAKDYGKTV